MDLSPQQVRDRFQWAAHQGAPLWLWPELTVTDWMEALEQIAEVGRDVLTDRQPSMVLDGDPTAIGIAAYTSGMGPLLGHWLESGKMASSASVAAVLQQHLAHNRRRMQRLEIHASRVSRAFSDSGIDHVFLKGMHTAFVYYPEPGTRPLADIDLLIAPRDRGRAGQVLRGCGFEAGPARKLPTEQTWRSPDSPPVPRSLSLLHSDDPWQIDLHVSLDRRYAPGSPIVRFDRVLDETQVGPCGSFPDAQVLRQPLLLLNLAVHASSGLQNLTLIRMVEMALVVRKDVRSSSFSWDIFVETADRADALGCAYAALEYCEQFVPGTVPEDVLRHARGKVPERVLRVLDSLGPASAHRVARYSLAERFMWSPTWSAIARQILSDIAPPGATSLSKLLEVYRARMWRLARGTLIR